MGGSGSKTLGSLVARTREVRGGAERHVPDAVGVVREVAVHPVPAAALEVVDADRLPPDVGGAHRSARPEPGRGMSHAFRPTHGRRLAPGPHHDRGVVQGHRGAPVGTDHAVRSGHPGTGVGRPGGRRGELHPAGRVAGAVVGEAALQLRVARHRLLAVRVGPAAHAADVAAALAFAFRTLAFPLLLADQGELAGLDLLLGHVPALVVGLVAEEEVVPFTLTRVGAGDPAGRPELGLLLDLAARDAHAGAVPADHLDLADLVLARAVLVDRAVVQVLAAAVAARGGLVVIDVVDIDDLGPDRLVVAAVEVEDREEQESDQHRALGHG